MSTFRTAFLFAVGLVVLALGVTQFPTHSGAKTQESQQATFRTTAKKARRQTFVPGEIIVRYRSESMAKNRTGAMSITAQDGQ